jgi:prephenate dehydrogenase
MNLPVNVSRVGVIGAGLIGGSIAKRAVKAGYQVSVFDVDASIVDDVTSQGVVFVDDFSGFSGCDVIFVAVPVDAFESVIDGLRPFLREGQILSDVSSTKQSPVAALSMAPLGVTVIGGHPLAGSQVAGWVHSRADLFDDCVWVLCPSDGVTVPDPFMLLLTDLGAGRVLVCSAEAHDRAVAAISHGVQVAASSLAAAVMDVVSSDELPWLLASSGFRDSTRIAESSSTMWTPILLENADNVNEIVRAEIARLELFSKALASRDAGKITRLIEDGQFARKLWAENRDGK